MAAPDMEVIKDIPGYKVILKAVLKSQIQTLVEQLASTTDEESVILTASVVDGTLSHLGSSSGKVFLEDHEDIKSQFLGFCLKHHHKQKQEKERREAQEREEAMQRSMQAMRQQQQARFSSPGRQGYPHPMGMVRAAGPARMRTPPLRHQPYPMSRPQRPARSPGHAQPSTPSKLDGQIIKIEPDDNSNQSESDNVQTQDPSGTGSGSTETSQPSSPVVKPATPSHGPGASDNDDGESSNSTIPLNDGSDLKLSDTNPPGGLSLDSDLSNIIAASTSGDTNNEQQQQQSVNYDPNISVKLENVSGDPEMDLEITGVELGQRPVPEPSGSQEWMANVQDYMQGATGSAADMSSNQQGYSNIYGDQSGQMYINSNNSFPSDQQDLHFCPTCNKGFGNKNNMQRHQRIVHDGEKPFQCKVCEKKFSTKANLKSHMIIHMNKNLLGNCEKVSYE